MCVGGLCQRIFACRITEPKNANPNNSTPQTGLSNSFSFLFRRHIFSHLTFYQVDDSRNSSVKFAKRTIGQCKLFWTGHLATFAPCPSARDPAASELHSTGCSSATLVVIEDAHSIWLIMTLIYWKLNCLTEVSPLLARWRRSISGALRMFWEEGRREMMNLLTGNMTADRVEFLPNTRRV